MKTGIELIAEERQRQIDKEGYTIQDDSYEYGVNNASSDLPIAAACYALAEDARNNYNDNTIPAFWPWRKDLFKPTPNDRVKELTKAGALIAAEIDRLQYVSPPSLG